MRFGLTEDQVAFRDAVRELLAKECTPAVVRAAWDAAPGELDRGVWDSLDAMGVLGVLVPEEDGGLGLDETFLVPILEEAGRVALPHPLVETAMVAAPLAGVGAGMVTAELGGPNVPCAADADAILVERDGRLLVVDRDAVDLVPLTSVDRGRRAATISAARTGRVVTTDAAHTQLALDRGALGTAAVLIGLGQAMLDMTVGYVQERQQFGVPVGSFQAVKHHLADAALALEFARPARAAGGMVHRPWRAHSGPRRVDGQGHGVRRGGARGAQGPAVPWRHRLHRRGGPPPLPQADLGPGPGLGHQRPPHRPRRSSTRSHPCLKPSSSMRSARPSVVEAAASARSTPRTSALTASGPSWTARGSTRARSRM